MAKRKSKRRNTPSSTREPKKVGRRAAPEQEAEPQAAKPMSTAERREKRRAERKVQQAKQEMNSDVVAGLLANPTKTVTAEDLKSDYDYVLADLRSMGILAALLFLALIGLGLAQGFIFS